MQIVDFFDTPRQSLYLEAPQEHTITYHNVISRKTGLIGLWNDYQLLVGESFSLLIRVQSPSKPVNTSCGASI